MGRFEYTVATLRKLEVKLYLGFAQVAARPCELVVVAVLSLAGLEQAAAVMTGLGLRSLERAIAKLNTGDFEWVMAGLGELGAQCQTMLLEKQCQQGEGVRSR